MGDIIINNDYLENTKPSKKSEDIIYDNKELDTSTLFGDPGNSGIRYVGEDTTNRDYISDDFYYKSPEKTQDYRANAQSGLTRVAQIPFKAATTFASEVAKTPIILGGLAAGLGAEISDAVSGKDDNNFFDIAFNNKIIKSIDAIKEDAYNSSLLSSYMDIQTEEGDFFDKIGSTAFWATEGADVMGFMGSMLIPGLAISKLGAGYKMFKGLSKLKGIDKADEFGSLLLKKGFTPKNIDHVAITSANTVYEAGIETGSYLNGTEKELDRRLILPDGHKDKINQKQYDKLLSKAQNEGAFKIFASNIALLTVPNSINTAWIYGTKTNKKIFKEFNKNFDLKNNRIARKQKEYSSGILGTAEKVGGKAGKIGKVFGQNLLFEGALEEGGQMAAEKSATKLIEEDKAFDFNSLYENYLETLGSTDGQTAMFLGGLLGTGMYSISNSGNSKKRDKVIDKMISQSNQSLDTFLSYMEPDVYKKDKDGDTIFETNPETQESNPVIDISKTNKLLESLDSNEQLANAYYASVVTNNKEQSDRLFDILSTKFVLPFTSNEQLGPKILREILSNSNEVDTYAKEMSKDKSKVIDEIVNKAESIKESKEDFIDLYESMFEEFEDISYDKMEDFKNSIANDYLGLKINKRYLNKKINEIKNLKEKSSKDLSNTSVGDASNDIDRTESGRYFNKLIENYNKELDKVNNDLSEFWSQNKFNSNLEKFKKDQEKIEAKGEKEVVKINEVLETIDKAKDLTELNQISNSLEEKYKNNPVIFKKIKNKSEEYEAKEQEVIKNAEEANNNAENNKLTFEEVKENFVKGDTFTPTNNNNLPESFKGDTLTVSKVSEDSITIKNSKGSSFQLTPAKENLSTTDGIVDTNTSTMSKNDIKAISDGLDTSTDNKDAKTIVTNEDGTKPEYVSENAYEYQMNPKNKKGKVHKVKIDKSTKTADSSTKKLNNFEKAIDLYESKDNFNEEDIEFLSKYLPLSVVVDENTELKMLTYPKSNAKSQKAFNESTYVLRKKIVQTITANKSNSVSIEIKYQKNGDLQISPKVNGKVQENSLADLYEFGGNINNVTEDKFFIVDEKGNLKNTNGEYYTGSLNRKLAKGELYVQITTAAGQKFPLKVNVKKINNNQAEAIYLMYKEMLESNDSNMVFEDLSQESQDSITELIGEDINFIATEINENKEDLILKEIINFYNYQKSNNNKIATNFDSNGMFVFGEFVKKEDFIGDKMKKAFIKDLTSKKRINVRFKNNNKNLNPVFNFKNRNYLEHLLKNNIINTNAVTGKDNFTFKGDTSIYYNANKIYINGKLKESNPSSLKELYNNVIESYKKIGNKTGEVFEMNEKEYKIFKGLGIVFIKRNGKFSVIQTQNEIKEFLNSLYEQIKILNKKGGPVSSFNSININKIKELYLLNNKVNNIEKKEIKKTKPKPKPIENNQTELEDEPGGIDPSEGITEGSKLEEFLNSKKENTQSTKPAQQGNEVKVTPSQLIDIMNLKIPTQPGINRILGLDLSDDSTIKYLEEKGIVSKFKGAKGREFLISKEDALNILQPTQQVANTKQSELEKINEAEKEELENQYKEKGTNVFKKIHKDKDATSTTELENKLINKIIEKGIADNLTAEEIYGKILERGFSNAIGMASEINKIYIQDRIDNKTNVKVGESISENIKARYQAQRDALNKKAPTPEKVVPDNLTKKENNSKNNSNNIRNSQKNSVSLSEDVDAKEVIKNLSKKFRGTELAKPFREVLKMDHKTNKDKLNEIYNTLKNKVSDKKEFDKICKIK